VNVICIGAHPDDCEIGFGGTALKLAASGYRVKFVSVTDGSAGHHTLRGAPLAAIRAKEAAESAARLGIAEYEVMDGPDGRLMPTLDGRAQLIAAIRTWQSDVVITHRPWDYHPDHRYTSQMVQDSAYLVVAPAIMPEVEPLRRNPVFLYFEDRFEAPTPFMPHIAVAVDDVWESKIRALAAHASQVFDWLPWVDGRAEEVPADACSRLQWLSRTWTRPIRAASRVLLERRYGNSDFAHAEVFEVCEYGRQLSAQEQIELFPR
jgi:LmbE family N-acetylglucosaminyl deacetylase